MKDVFYIFSFSGQSHKNVKVELVCTSNFTRYLLNFQIKLETFKILIIFAGTFELRVLTVIECPLTVAKGR